MYQVTEKSSKWHLSTRITRSDLTEGKHQANTFMVQQDVHMGSVWQQQQLHWTKTLLLECILQSKGQG